MKELKLNFLGKIFLFITSAIVAMFITDKFLEKHPEGVREAVKKSKLFSWFVLYGVVMLVIIFVAILIDLFSK